MQFKKYKNALILFIFYVVLLLAFGIFAMVTNSGEMSSIVPGENLGIEIIMIFLISFTLGALIAVLLGYLLGPLFLFVQKNTTGRKLNYGIQERPEITSFKKNFRAFFPALMAINLAMLLGSASIVQDIVAPSGTDASNILLATTIAMLMFTVPLSMALFSGAWFLLDSGIIHTNKEKDMDKDEPIEVKSVGGVLTNVLKGYAGLGVLFTFYELFILVILSERGFADFISIIILVAPLPIFIMLAAIPSIIFLEITKKNRVNYMRKLADLFYKLDDIDVKLTKKE